MSLARGLGKGKSLERQDSPQDFALLHRLDLPARAPTRSFPRLGYIDNDLIYLLYDQLRPGRKSALPARSLSFLAAKSLKPLILKFSLGEIDLRQVEQVFPTWPRLQLCR